MSLGAKTSPSRISAVLPRRQGNHPYVPIAIVSIYTNVRKQELDSLDYLVRAGEERGRHAEAELLRGFEIDCQ
jgi:hypothetical protein